MSRYAEEKRFLHGGDYNPDQWLKYPQILKDDIELMQLANTNTFTLGIFAWSALEPEEGVFEFKWLDEIFENIHSFGGNVILATPSGARPAWMSQKYPEVLRTNERREKMMHGGRHNHCFSSPVYREKVEIMNQKLVERYGNHPALIMWHISNEYSGDCHCEYCQNEFREWLKKKYVTLDALNHAWWGPFWSHSYSEWDQIVSPSSKGESAVHGMNLDWKRFVTDQTIDFYEHECKPMRKMTPQIPITTNFMADTDDLIPFQSLDYGKFSKHVDILSWDCYPAWHNDWGTTAQLACKVGFINDLYRSLKQQPFLIMECTPSGVNWHNVNKMKRPGMHLLSSMQLLSHGSDSILYFQWRKSRGSSEKFHGAVVDHDNSANNRVFKEVAKVGETLEKIQEIKGSDKASKVAIVYDWDSNWALNDAQGFGKATKRYPETLQEHYSVFWKKNISMDVITPNHDFNKYDLVIAPMLYLMSEETIIKMKQYVEQGGQLVASYITGLVNESDLTYLGGWASSLQETFGINIEEIDTLYPKDSNRVSTGQKEFKAKDYCSVIQNQSAKVLATYQEDFYKDSPAVTVNTYGQGKAYYIGMRTEEDYLQEFYHSIINELGLDENRDFITPEGVSVQVRESNGVRYYFVMNFSESTELVTFNHEYYDIVNQQMVKGQVTLQPYGFNILKSSR